MPKTISVQANYMEDAYRPTSEVLSTARADLHGVKFDTIVGTGLSGSLIIPRLAHAWKKNWLIVRKKNDGSHSSNVAEGTLGERWIFMDDLIASGNTKQHVMDQVKYLIDYEDHSATYVGDYLYSSEFNRGRPWRPVETEEVYPVPEEVRAKPRDTFLLGPTTIFMDDVKMEMKLDNRSIFAS